MSLGEDPSVEHGILAAEDLRWLPEQRSREVRYPQTCWNPDATEKRGPVPAPCAQDEVVEVAFALPHHEAIKIAATPAIALAVLARQGRREVRVSTFGDTGVHGSTVGSQTYRFAHSLQERTTAVSDGSGVFENEGL